MQAIPQRVQYVTNISNKVAVIELCIYKALTEWSNQVKRCMIFLIGFKILHIRCCQYRTYANVYCPISGCSFNIP